MTLVNVNENYQTINLTVELINVNDIKIKSTMKPQSMMTLIVGNDENEILLYERHR